MSNDNLVTADASVTNGSDDRFDSWVRADGEENLDTTLLSHRWLETTNLAMLAHRADGDIVFVNPAAAELVGVQRQELIGQSLNVLFGEEWYAAHHHQIEATTPEASGFTNSLSIDGEPKRRFDIDSTTLFTSTGQLGLVCLLLTDVTELLNSNDELVEANKRLAESNRDLADFAHVASHDLREPLRKITTFAGRIRERVEDSLDTKSLDYLDRMENASRRMSRLIDDILAFAQASSVKDNLSAVDLERVVDQVLSDLERAIRDTGAIVHRGNLPTIEGDASQFGQLFQNLIANALKFHKHDQAPEIWIDGDVRGAQWVLTVRDDGIGFDPEHKEKIFTMFERLHGLSHYGGSGVGLSICQRIVERNGGTITAHSQAGAGATFEVLLPRSMTDLLSAA